MYLDVIALLAGFLCLFVVCLMLFNQKRNRITNGYLIVILIVVGLQRFLYAIDILGLTKSTYSPLGIKPLLAFYIVPVYYLFFSRVIYGTGNLKKESLHFIFPTVLVVINSLYLNYNLNRWLYGGFSVTYFVLILVIVQKYIFRKNPSMLNKNTYQATKHWLLLMLALTFLLIIYSNFFPYRDLSSQVNLSSFYRYSSLIWFGLLVYMFKNPVIIFGEQSLLKNIQLNKPQDFQIWNHKPLKAIEYKDKIVNNTVLNRVESIILEIKTLQKSVPLISKTTLNTTTLAIELKVPKRHLDFIFKYYCHYSINDFSNLVKVNYALTLIGNGYLENYTVDSLGKECLFNSRFTFSKNFKKFVGVSVSEFVNTQDQA